MLLAVSLMQGLLLDGNFDRIPAGIWKGSLQVSVDGVGKTVACKARILQRVMDGPSGTIWHHDCSRIVNVCTVDREL
jgi:hypothetical protein